MTAIKVKIESLTPIHIGNGESFRSIFIKNFSRLNEEEVFDAYAEEILKTNKFEFDEILIKKLIDEKSFSVLYSYDEIHKDVLINSVEIQEVIKEWRNEKLTPYIPASSIKGFFSTVILNYHKIEDVTNPKMNWSLIGTLLKKNKILDFLEIEDCKLEKYKLKIGKLVFGKRPSSYAFIEVIDEFVGTFRIKISKNYDINKLLENSNNFVNNYINILKTAKNKEKVIEQLEKLEKEENKIVLGRYAGRSSKVISISKNKSNYCKYLEIDNKISAIGFAKLTIL